MTVEATVADDRDLAELGTDLRSEIVEAIREATVDDADADNLAPARVRIDVDAEAIALPAEGDDESTVRNIAGP